MPSPGTAIALIRTLIGTGALVAPKLTAGLFGLDVAGNPQAPFLARLFGVRELALVVSAGSATGGTRRTALATGAACDLADVGAAILAARDGSLPKSAAVMVAATGLAAAGLSAAALQLEA